MATLEMSAEDRSLGSGASAKLVRIAGSIDTSTVSQFDDALSTYISGEHPLVVLDLADLEYVNSRGMAYLIKHHDAVTRAGGQLVLAALPEKIQATFETMGLDSTFIFEPDVEHALNDLAVEGLVLGSSGSSDSASFPLSFTCDACLAPLTAAGAGKYRCPRCQACFEVTSDGKVVTFPAREARSVEISLPCRATYVESARAAAASVAKDVDLSAIATELLDRTVDEAMGLFVGKSGDAGAAFRMFVAADNREFTVAFVVTDESIFITDADERDLTFRTLKGIVDELDVVPLEPGGQLLRLVKRLAM